MANWKRPACTLIANYPSYPKNRAEAEYARAFKIAKRTIFSWITLEAIVNVSIEKGQAKTFRSDLAIWSRRVSDRIPFREGSPNHRPSRHIDRDTIPSEETKPGAFRRIGTDWLAAWRRYTPSTKNEKRSQRRDARRVAQSIRGGTDVADRLANIYYINLLRQKTVAQPPRRITFLLAHRSFHSLPTMKIILGYGSGKLQKRATRVVDVGWNEMRISVPESNPRELRKSTASKNYLWRIFYAIRHIVVFLLNI